MNIRPIRDQVIIQRAESATISKGGIVIPTTVQEKSFEGTVIAVGTGKVLENGKLVEPSVKVGDKVIFAKHTYAEVKVDGTDYLVVREDNILAVLDNG